MIDAAIISKLKTILGSSALIADPETVEKYSNDALTPARAFSAQPLLHHTADLVVKPNDTHQVSEIVKVASEHRIPIIPYGGGTGVMGAVVPLRSGIIIDLGDMNRILHVDRLSRTVTVQAGTLLKNLATTLDNHGLLLGHDPWSVPIATVGGTISTNGVGYRAASVGPMGSQVIALEVVLPSGSILATRRVPKYSSGPNLNQLFIGSEGTLGVITNATLRVLEQPEERLFSTFRFPTFELGFNSINSMFGIGLRPSVVDLTEDFEGVHLYMVFEGYREQVEAQQCRSSMICNLNKGRDLGPTEAMIYWDTRYQIAEQYKNSVTDSSRTEIWNRQSKEFDYLHIALPASTILEYRKRVDKLLNQYDIRVTEYAVWTAPELFSMVLVPGNLTKRGDLQLAVDQALMLAQDMGGIMEYCHGVGIKLAHLLAREMGLGQRIVSDIKQVLDPYNIMNPGKLGL
ncbi:FAD-binding oxidoreductase [SAR202 cluster bacterium AD-804-J14_MRT_500m]|nr:FAD-binding oxidoreductase [SAR202 cluster bacterium AD-804-J14_MRT_500m]